MMMALNVERAARDMKGAVDYLEAHEATTGRGVAAVGFCMGGGLLLWLACLSDKIIAAEPFYGVAPWPETEPDFTKTRAAFQGHYGDQDEIPAPTWRDHSKPDCVTSDRKLSSSSIQELVTLSSMTAVPRPMTQRHRRLRGNEF